MGVILVAIACGCGDSGQASDGLTSSGTYVNSAALYHALNGALNAMRSGYQSGNWDKVRTLFESPSIGDDIVSSMQRWHAEHVHPLDVTLVHASQTGEGRAVGTVELSSDPRAMPYFYVWQFDTSEGNPIVIGTASGIGGDNFKDARWQSIKSAHFVFYHGPFELQGQDRAGIKELEYQRTIFIRKFGVKLPPVAAYYLYPDTKVMSQLTRQACGKNPDNIGCATPFTSPPDIHAAIWPTFHEPIHVFQRALEPPPKGDLVNVAPYFIAEGMAVALEDKQVDPDLSDYCSDLKYIPLSTCAHIAISHVVAMDLLTDDGFLRTPPGYAYSLGGSFVGFLIHRYGYRTFGRFYYVLAAQPKDTIADYDRATTQVFHTRIASLISRWKAELCGKGCF